MERHKALAAAATVTTLLTATGAVALAATGNSGLLGFGSPFGLQRASAQSAYGHASQRRRDFDNPAGRDTTPRSSTTSSW